MEALQDLMNRGFLVFENPDKTWAVAKIPTSYDNRTLESLAGCGNAVFPTRASAIERAVEYSGVDLRKPVEYSVEVTHNDGLGPKFLILGTVSCVTTTEAESRAREMAEAHFSDKKGLRWEYRVRPVDWVAVMLTPKEARTDQEVLDVLRNVGAREVEVLAPRFISAQVPSSHISDLGEVAEVQVKARKQMN